jgi:cupin superfamily protein DUF985
MDADDIIARLGLAPHPEGGWYRETFRDSPAAGGRGALTQIYYLLRAGERSRWHRIDAVEVWHFYAGDPLGLRVVEPDGGARRLVLVFDRDQALAPEFRGDGFMLSWTEGAPMGDSIAGPFADAGQDLLHLELVKANGVYRLHATRIVGGFENPIDAEIVGNRIYVLEYGGTQDIWEVTLPR